MKRSLPRGPILATAAVILAVGLAVIVSSFFREVLPRFAGDFEPLLRAGIAMFFIGATYFLAALVSLFTLKPTPPDDDRGVVDGVDTRITLSLRDPATHVATSILILVGAAVLLTVSLTRPDNPTAGHVAGTEARSASEADTQSRADDQAGDSLAP